MATIVPAPAIACDALTREHRKQLLLCSTALLVVIATWFVAIRSPLWLDETWTYWQISGSAHEVWTRNSATVDSTAYMYLLWLWTKLFGTTEIALRIPSIIATAVALLAFHRAARSFLAKDTALIATTIFAAHPVVGFESIDARPYAFATLALGATFYLLFRFRRSTSSWPPFCLGISAALVVAFQYLFASIVPALLLSLVLLHEGPQRGRRKKLLLACSGFLVSFLPLIPGTLNLFRVRQIHVFEGKPTLPQLIFAIAPPPLLFVFAAVMVVAVLLGRQRIPARTELAAKSKYLSVCLSLGLIPISLLFGISLCTSVHLFTPRHYLVAIPGLALSFAVLVDVVFVPARRALFCLALAGFIALPSFAFPGSRSHGYSWKQAIAAANAASADDTPIVVCSDFSEADYVHMPVASPNTSNLYAPLSYYPLAGTVVPMPRTLNAEAVRTGRAFLADATAHHRRFLAMGFVNSADILSWLVRNAAPDYNARLVGDFDYVRVIEFTPNPDRAPSKN